MSPTTRTRAYRLTIRVLLVATVAVWGIVAGVLLVQQQRPSFEQSAACAAALESAS